MNILIIKLIILLRIIRKFLTFGDQWCIKNVRMELVFLFHSASWNEVLKLSFFFVLTLENRALKDVRFSHF